jgi:hypothetical protein
VTITSVLLDVVVNHGQLMAEHADLARFVLDYSLFLLQHPSRANCEIVFEIFGVMLDAYSETSVQIHRAGYAKLLSALVADCVLYAADFVSRESFFFDNHRARLRNVLRDCCTNAGIGTVGLVLSSFPQQFT